MIDTVVWDLGGVLLDRDPRHLYRHVFDDAGGPFAVARSSKPHAP